MRRLIILIAALSLLGPPLYSQEFRLPMKPNSVRFAVIGDMGTGGRDQYETAQRMAEAHQRFPFEFVIMVGDNIYGANGPSDMAKKFEIPYKPLLDAGVQFYAALGNHDDVNEKFYKYFNMNGQQYYTFKKGNVRFFALDSNYMTPEQQAWLAKELTNSGSQWKIAYFHHPLYSSAGTHGSSLELRSLLEPLFTTYKVQLVFEGHDHVYERVKPQGGTVYFTEGSSGQLRSGDLKRASFTDTGFDTEQTFMLVEIAGDEMYFQTISRTGRTVDSGVIVRADKTQTATAAPPAPDVPLKAREKEVVTQGGTTTEIKPGGAETKTAPSAPEEKPKTTVPPEKQSSGAAAPTSLGAKATGDGGGAVTTTTTAAKSAAPSSATAKAVGNGGSKTTTTTAKTQPASSTSAKSKKSKATAHVVRVKAKKKKSHTLTAKKSKGAATVVPVSKPKTRVVVAQTPS